VPARGKKQVRYLSFLASAPPEFEGLRDIKIDGNKLLLFGAKNLDPLPLAASGIGGIFPVSI
jgi:hypothetical protein